MSSTKATKKKAAVKNEETSPEEKETQQTVTAEIPQPESEAAKKNLAAALQRVR